jgi:hypothetical protein
VTDWMFYGGLFLFAGFFVLNGLLMTAIPHVHRKFLSWVMHSSSWSLRADSAPQRGLEFERRLVGLVLTGMGLYFARGAVAGLAGAKHISESTPGPANISGDWFRIIVGIGLLALGARAVARPDSLVRWSIKHHPTARKIPDSTVRVWRIGAQALGAAFVLGGLYAFWVTLAHG